MEYKANFTGGNSYVVIVNVARNLGLEKTHIIVFLN